MKQITQFFLEGESPNSGKIYLNSWSTGRRISTAESDLSKVAPATLL